MSDIKVLENVKFENLEKLYLYYNQITEINIFEKENLNAYSNLLFGRIIYKCKSNN